MLCSKEGSWNILVWTNKGVNERLFLHKANLQQGEMSINLLKGFLALVW